MYIRPYLSGWSKKLSSGSAQNKNVYGMVVGAEAMAHHTEQKLRLSI